MKEKYVFLSSTPGATRKVLSEPSEVELLRAEGQAARPGWENSTGAGALSVEVDEIDRDTLGRKISTLAQHANVLAFAPVVPMKLIAPLSVQGMAPLVHQGIAWGVNAVGADTSPFSGNGIVVAVLDTGIDPSHPAFSGVQLIQRDFTGEGNGDLNGHGTHCAGTIFGRNFDETRIGVAPGVKTALIGKVLSKKGGASDQIVSAIQWSMQSGANIISMSLGIDFPGLVRQLQDANWPAELATSRALEGYRANVVLFERLASFIRAQGAFSQATVIVAAAGNESRRDENPNFKIAVSPPAVAEGIISVAALGQGKSGLTVAPFSNTGANIAGPGIGVVSAAAGGGSKALSGTSMATPHVAGVAALWAEWLASRRSLTTEQLTVRLTSSGDTKYLEPGFDSQDVGFGLIRAPQTTG